jgi:hypothetical protein
LAGRHSPRRVSPRAHAPFRCPPNQKASGKHCWFGCRWSSVVLDQGSLVRVTGRWDGRIGYRAVSTSRMTRHHPFHGDLRPLPATGCFVTTCPAGSDRLPGCGESPPRKTSCAVSTR